MSKRFLSTNSSVLIYVVIILCAVVGGGIANASISLGSVPDADNEAPHDSSVMFVENAGQWHESVRFQAWNDSAGTMWLVEDAIWISVIEPDSSNQMAENNDRLAPKSPYMLSDETTLKGVNIRISFPGANPTPIIETLDSLDTTISYFIGNDPEHWQPAVPVWGGVRYKELWPGVDLEFGRQKGRLMQRFVAREGADIGAVRLQVEGAEGIDIDNGLLHLTTAGRDLALPAPLADFTYPVRLVAPDGSADTVDVQHADAEIKSQSVASPAENWDELIYSTFLGGSNSDGSSGIIVDHSGSAYVTGYTKSSNLPTTPGDFDPGHNGDHDSFVAKLSPDGRSLVYSTFIGGSASDGGYSVVVDAAGNAYVTGYTGSTNFPTSSGSYDTSFNGPSDGYDAFVVKLNPAGSGLIYSTYLGGGHTDGGHELVVDGAGNACVAGRTESANFPTKNGAFDTSHNGFADAFVVKLNQNGSGLSYATFLGGSSDDGSNGIAMDGAGNAYVSGSTESYNFPTTVGAFDTSYNGEKDTFVVKLNAAGSALFYSTFLGGTSPDSGYAIAVDDAGNAYTTGDTESPDFPTTTGAFDRSYNNGTDVFIAKLDPAGNSLVYATFLGGSDFDRGLGIDATAAGSTYVTGSTNSSNFPTTAGAFDRGHNGRNDAFALRLDQDGKSLTYATFLGSSSDDWSNDIIVDEVGNIYTTGYAGSSNFPTVSGGFDTSHNGNYDAFISRLMPEGIATPTPTVTPTVPTPTPTPTPTLPPLPDLTVNWMNIELETGGSCNYTSTSLGVRTEIGNIGNADAGSFILDVNGVQRSIPDLDAGSSSRHWFGGYNYGYENVAIIDALQQITESNETNNELRQMLPIPTLPPTCTPSPPPSSGLLYLPVLFRLSATPSPTPSPTATSTPVPGDPYEPNGSTGEAWGPLESNIPYWFVIWGEEDVWDFYYFEMSNQHDITARLSNMAADANYHFHLYNDKSQLIDYSGNHGNDDEEVFAAGAPPGKYYLAVKRIEGADSAQPYLIQVIYR